MRRRIRLNQFAPTGHLQDSSSKPIRLASNRPPNSRQYSSKRKRPAASRQHSSRPTRLASNRPPNSRQHSSKQRNFRRRRQANNRQLSSVPTVHQVHNLFHNPKCNRPNGPRRSEEHT